LVKYIYIYRLNTLIVITKLRIFFFLVFVLATRLAFAQAPNISYATPQTYTTGSSILPLQPINTGGVIPSHLPVLLGSGFDNIKGIAVDLAGNVYVADDGNAVVVEIPIGGGPQITLGSGFSSPVGVAVDKKGNVYVSDAANASIKEIPVGGGTILTLGSGFNEPLGVAVDGSGNLYVGDAGNNEVKEIPTGSSVPIIIGSGFNRPFGVAVDVAGNVYVADEGNNAIKEILAAGGATVLLASGSGSPTGVAVDKNGNVYFADGDISSITEIPAGGGSDIAVGSFYLGPQAVAVDASLTVYEAANSGADKVADGGYSINPVLPVGLVFDTATGIVSGTPITTAPAANYDVTGYNQNGSSGTIINIEINLPPKPVISYGSPQVYLTHTAISPLSPSNSGGAAASEKTITLASGLVNPLGAAIDLSGNVYVAENGNNDVKKIPPGGGTPIIIGSGFSAPTGVAVDHSGNVYVVDNGNKAIKEIPVGGGAIVTINTGFASPYGVALDASGNIYVSDAVNNNVVKIPAGGVGTIIIGSGFNLPTGIAVDAAGNVYVADRGNNAIKEIPVAGGSIITLLSGLIAPNGVAVDNLGNIYSDDFGTSGIERFPASGGKPIALGAGFFEPTGVAVDVLGNVYVSDNGNTAIKQITPGGLYIGPSLPAGLSFDNTTGIISGTPTVPSPATNYTITGYNSGGGGTTTLNITVNPYPIPVISYKTPQVYFRGQAITPLMPATSGVAAADTSTVALTPGLTDPTGVAIDKSGNVYIAENRVGRIDEIQAASGNFIQLATGFNGPTGVAVDAAGNVYLIDNGNNSIKEIPAGGGATIIIASGFNGPYGIALDGAGSIYIGDSNNNEVKKILAGSTTPVIIGTGFNHPTGVAVDAAGNVYVADRGNNAIKKILATDGSTITVASGDGNPNGVAVDSQGNVYFADTNEEAIIKIPVNGGSKIGVGSGLGNPAGLALDADDAVYVAAANGGSDESGNIDKISRAGGYYISPALPTGLSLDDNTGAITGTPIGASPATIYTVSAYNIGGSASATVNISVISIATLSKLTISSGTLSPAFATGTTSYTDDVANTVTSIAFRAITTDPTATETINGTAVPEGTVSPYFPLNVGLNTITVIVTAQDGVIKDTYTVAVTRMSNIATLSGLTISSGILSPGFATATTSYTDKVANTVTSIAFRATTTDPAATETIDGTAVPEGTVSPYFPLNVGLNTITIVVTASDGVTKETYTVAVTRISNIATLSGLTVSSGTLTPAFATATTSYTDKVANTVTSIAFRATTTDPAATETINGTAVPEGTISPYFPLNVGLNTITIIVTASDGVTKDTYTVAVTRMSSIATLSNLSVSSGILSPGFATGTTSYTDEVYNTVTSIAMRATTTDAAATETINGTAVPQGMVSPYMPLNIGLNTITVVVTATDGVTKATYTIAVTRISNIATLSKLTISSGTLTPAFVTGTTSYADTVANSAASIAIRAITTDPTATETINGKAVPEGTISPYFPMNVFQNTITIIVTAQDNLTQDTYTVAVYREPAANVELSALTMSDGTLSPVFSGGNDLYSASVSNAVTSVTVTPTTYNPTSTVTINGTAGTSGQPSAAQTLAVGLNNIPICVAAQDGLTVNCYDIAVTRAPPPSATLSKLTVSSGTLSPAFATATMSYTDNVANTVSSIAFRAITTDPIATETIDGTAVPEGTVSPYFPLNVGSNTITIIVTASDGVTKDTYTIMVTVATPPVADAVYQPISVETTTENPQLSNDDILVHIGVSPNGDGIDDFFKIDNITNYPDNRLMIMNRNGMLVYETKGYDNASKLFDGHSNKNGAMQLPGTYFYELNYIVNGITKHKTGFLVLKY
jgi:gliding motility-associated-like protein